MTATPTAADEEIRRNVRNELKWDRRVRLRDLDVSVQDGVVTLTGAANYCVEALQAERAAKRVHGVKAVISDIDVRVAECDQRDDAELLGDVRRVLETDVQIPADEVEATVSDGWVTLRGEVDWDYQRRAAENAVTRLAGVRGINNLMTVRPWQRPSAEELKQKIEQALRRNCETDADAISVEIDGRTATLTGTVRAWCEKDVAGQIAWFAPGITSVDNRIEVNPDGGRPPGTKVSDLL